MDFDNILETYNKLTADEPTSWEVFSGETSRIIAEEKGIPQEKFSDDCVEMQIGQQVLAEELEEGIPETADECESRIKALIEKHIRSSLRMQKNDVARRGLLLQTLQAAGLEDEELAELRHYDLENLQNKLVELTYQHTINTVLPEIKRQCNLLMMDPDQKNIVLENAGALAVAGYMEVPEVQHVPEVIGSTTELASCYSGTDTSSSDILNGIAFGLIVIAGITASLALISLGASVFSAAAAEVLVEGSFAGVGAAVTADIGIISGFVAGMLKFSLGAAVASCFTALISKLAEWEGSSVYAKHTTERYKVSV